MLICQTHKHNRLLQVVSWEILSLMPLNLINMYHQSIHNCKVKLNGGKLNYKNLSVKKQTKTNEEMTEIILLSFKLIESIDCNVNYLIHLHLYWKDSWVTQVVIENIERL